MDIQQILYNLFYLFLVLLVRINSQAFRNTKFIAKMSVVNGLIDLFDILFNFQIVFAIKSSSNNGKINTINFYKFGIISLNLAYNLLNIYLVSSDAVMKSYYKNNY
jgi:hypothetical protein